MYWNCADEMKSQFEYNRKLLFEKLGQKFRLPCVWLVVGGGGGGGGECSINGHDDTYTHWNPNLD